MLSCLTLNQMLILLRLHMNIVQSFLKYLCELLSFVSKYISSVCLIQFTRVFTNVIVYFKVVPGERWTPQFTVDNHFLDIFTFYHQFIQLFGLFDLLSDLVKRFSHLLGGTCASIILKSIKADYTPVHTAIIQFVNHFVCAICSQRLFQSIATSYNLFQVQGF